jgi:hypothetical protein
VKLADVDIRWNLKSAIKVTLLLNYRRRLVNSRVDGLLYKERFCSVSFFFLANHIILIWEDNNYCVEINDKFMKNQLAVILYLHRGQVGEL